MPTATELSNSLNTGAGSGAPRQEPASLLPDSRRESAPFELDSKLTEAIEAGDFDAVQALAEEYGATLRAEVLAAPANERPVLARKAVEKLNGHLQFARVVRSHICAHLNAVTREALYHPAGKREHTWQVEG